MSDIVNRLDIKAGVMEMGEKIAWGSDTALMREAGRAIEAQGKRIEGLEAENQRLTSLIKDIHDKLYDGEIYGWDDGSDEWQEMRVIARKALLGGGE